ncbi:MAG: glutamyl-tRNA amidotransferase [Thermoleophilia bacterium]|jgi:aspartyl-tRNA(Asn)/glutamyl-tRNA(Gln) amidotransferase subunit C|nr:glutamyl-tRNA amidotransferase [Thermoleophilia bacterium]
MTKITIEDTRHVAKLARLGLADEQLETLTGELNTIIESIGKIAELDLDDVVPTTHALEVVNVFGEDVPHTSLTAEQALSNAPDPENGLFRVPKMHS